MAKVFLMKGQKLGGYPATYSLMREGSGPGRCEGHGFKTIKEAEDFAAKYGHEITHHSWTVGKVKR
jgi:hypothetical protein